VLFPIDLADPTVVIVAFWDLDLYIFEGAIDGHFVLVFLPAFTAPHGCDLQVFFWAEVRAISGCRKRQGIPAVMRIARRIVVFDGYGWMGEEVIVEMADIVNVRSLVPVATIYFCTIGHGIWQARNGPSATIVTFLYDASYAATYDASTAVTCGGYRYHIQQSEYW
jgi:hypothetical protein